MERGLSESDIFPFVNGLNFKSTENEGGGFVSIDVFIEILSFGGLINLAVNKRGT